MRKNTLAAISFIIAFIILYVSREMLFAYNLWIGPRTFAGTGILSLPLALVIALILTPLNRWLLKKRKEGGRDIEDEERYESDHGMISLTPKDEEK
jgi:uncharacterized membrane protein (DUF485 family)